MIELARRLRRPDPDRRPISLRKVPAALAERGYVASQRCFCPDILFEAATT
jgi:hypothetical protein